MARRSHLGLALAASVAVASLAAPMIAAVLPNPAHAQTRVTDLDELVGWAFPSGLVSAANAPVVAWVRNERGARNVWAAAGPEWIARQLTVFAGDDGQEVGGLAITANGEGVAFVRGGAPNRAGEVPNPTSDPAGAERAVWTVATGFGGAGAPTRDGGAAPDAGYGGAAPDAGYGGAAPDAGDDAADGSSGPWPRAVKLATEPTRVGPGHSPVWGAGESLFYIDGGVVWWLSDRGAGPEALVRGRGSPGELRPSPTGRHLAWTSQRGDHAFVGVLDLESRELRYLDPTLDHDGSPAWSPDGSEIAFVRTPNRAGRLPFFAVREGHPWSIRAVRLADGSARTVFRASEGRGSVFRAVSAANQIFWGADDRIAFPWERNGFTNMYSVGARGGGDGSDPGDGSAPADGSDPGNGSAPGDGDGDQGRLPAPLPLAPGEHEVQYVAMEPGGEALVLSSNQGDVDRQHLWRAPLDGGEAQLLTPGNGIEWLPTPVPAGPEGESALVFLASSGTVPAHAEVLASGTRRWLVESAEDELPGGLTDPEQVVFRSADGMPIHGQLFLPAGDPPPGGWPGLLFLHGGSRRQMLLGFHHRGYYHNTYSFNQHLAAQGYAVLSVNFRSGIGYGLDFREAEHYGADGAAEVQDVLGAGVYMAARGDVDGSRIGLWGGSYGGYLTAHGLAQASHLFRAGVDIHGVHDWNVGIANFVPSYNPAARPDLARRAFESSPFAHLDRWTSPVLLIHGDDDRNVRFSESVDLAEALRARGVHVESLVFPDEVHGFLLHRNWMAAFRAAEAFFDRWVK